MSSNDVPTRQYLPTRRKKTDYPLIDNDPHFFRAIRYMRPSDYALGAGLTVGTPLSLYVMEKIGPTFTSKATFRHVFRLAIGIGLTAGFLAAYSQSVLRFQGVNENKREVELDMREMVDKVKRGEPLYGTSSLEEHQQHMAARNSRFSNFFIGVIPWFNFVNHPHHGVDTAKYYQQAERELEAGK